MDLRDYFSDSSEDEENNANTTNKNFSDKLIYSKGALVLISPSKEASKKKEGDVATVIGWSNDGMIDVRWNVGGKVKRRIDPSSGLVAPTILETKERKPHGNNTGGAGLLSCNRPGYKNQIPRDVSTQQPPETEDCRIKSLLAAAASGFKWKAQENKPHPLVKLLSDGKRKKSYGWMVSGNKKKKKTSPKKKTTYRRATTSHGVLPWYSLRPSQKTEPERRRPKKRPSVCIRCVGHDRFENNQKIL